MPHERRRRDGDAADASAGGSHARRRSGPRRSRATAGAARRAAGLRGRWVATWSCATSAWSPCSSCCVVVGTLTSDNFLTPDNIENILVSSSVIGVVTVGMTFVIIGGGIDLSVGALVALASVWATTLATQSYGRRSS